MDEIVTTKTRLMRGNGASPEVFAAIPGVFNITPPTPARPKIPVSDLNDLAVRIKVGIVDNGDMTIQYNWDADDPTQEGLYSDYLNGTLRNFRIEYPDAAGGAPPAGGSDSFSAYVLSVTRQPIEINGRLTRTAAIAITGTITES